MYYVECDYNSSGSMRREEPRKRGGYNNENNMHLDFPFEVNPQQAYNDINAHCSCRKHKSHNCVTRWRNKAPVIRVLRISIHLLWESTWRVFINRDALLTFLAIKAGHFTGVGIGVFFKPFPELNLMYLVFFVIWTSYAEIVTVNNICHIWS